MSQKMYVCEECGSGYLDVDACPRCHRESEPPGAKIHIPWVRTGTGWAQQRIDGSTWALSERGTEPSTACLDGVEKRTCEAKTHLFVGTEDARCPVCRPIYTSKRPAFPAQEKRKRPTKFGLAAVLVASVVGVAVVVAATSGSDTSDTATSAPTTTIGVTATTSTVVPADDPEFLDASAYESELLAIGRQTNNVANTVLEINTRWDNREISQKDASAQLAIQRTDARRIVAVVDAAHGFGADAASHEDMADTVQEFADAVAAVRKGLLEPGSRTGRDEATLETVGAANRLLLAIDDALKLDRQRLERDDGTLVSWASLRIGDCVDPTQQGEFTEIVACSEAGHGEVLATPTLPSQTTVTPMMCAKAAWPVVDPDEFDPAGGSWEVREAPAKDSGSGIVCTYIPAAATDALVVSDTPHAGPFVSDQWDALATLDLAPDRSVEVGECFVVSSDDEVEWSDDRYRVDCDEEHDFILSEVAAIAPPEGVDDLDRFDLRSWDICAEATSEWLDGDPYLVVDALVYPALLGIEDVESPMLTLACVLWTEPLSDNETASYDYQAGYAFAFVAAQAGVYDYGLIEDPESEAEIQFNEGFLAGQSDATGRRQPTTEMTSDLWIEAYLVGNSTGWVDGRGCTRPNPYPIPPDLGLVETEGWFTGYNAGLDSACNTGTAAPSWVGNEGVSLRSMGGPRHRSGDSVSPRQAVGLDWSVPCRASTTRFRTVDRERLCQSFNGNDPRVSY